MLSDSRIFLKETNSGARLGSSIPTRERPGIGASIRIWPVGAARARARSLDKALILESFVPMATSRAYWVTAGPKFTSTTLAIIPKASRVFSIIAAFELTLPLSALPEIFSDNKESGGECHGASGAAGGTGGSREEIS